MQQMLSIFYKEPDPDRWIPMDRYPRQAIRRLLRGPRQPGGMERYFLNLVDGLRRVGISVRINDFRWASQNPDQVIGIIGKGHLLVERRWRNPIVFGPAVYSHPLEGRDAFSAAPIKLLLASCEWFAKVYEASLDIPVRVWPAGINTYHWTPSEPIEKNIDVLVYDKIRWERNRYVSELLNPILVHVKRLGLRTEVIRYGYYKEEGFRELLRRSKSMVFLVEHETQGFAYLQALACGVPIFAWERGGPCKEPEFILHNVNYGPVSSTPYWDERCGYKFAGYDKFLAGWNAFWSDVSAGRFKPRDYVLENLSLEKCAIEYARIMQEVQG